MALLGITAGSAGLIAVADSLQEGSGLQWALFVLAVVPLVAAVVAIGTTLWLYRAYKDRQAAESDAEVHFARLIALDPDRFLPKAE